MTYLQKANSKEVIKCINIARQYPKYYLPLLEQQINSFANDYEYRINQQTICQTNQGKDAWMIAKKFLETQKPISPLIALDGLNKAAQSHSYDLQKIDQITHSGSDGSSFIDRIMKFCEKNQGALVEIIGNDFDISQRNHAQMIVLGLIIDDGVTSRGHRASIFNSDYKYIGCGIGYLSGKIVSVINMSESKLKEKVSSGNASTSTTNLTENKNSKKRLQEQVNIKNSRISQRQSQKSYESRSNISERSHKSQKVWTFTKVDTQERKIVCQQPRKNNDSKISINRSKNEEKIQYKQNSFPSSSSIKRQKINAESLCDSRKRQEKLQKSKREQENNELVCADVTNKSNLNKSKYSVNSGTNNQGGSGFKSTGSSGFRKIKQKKQMSRMWQEGEFKYEQKVTQIKYTDGTEEQYKQKKSLLLDQN